MLQDNTGLGVPHDVIGHPVVDGRDMTWRFLWEVTPDPNIFPNVPAVPWGHGLFGDVIRTGIAWLPQFSNRINMPVLLGARVRRQLLEDAWERAHPGQDEFDFFILRRRRGMYETDE